MTLSKAERERRAAAKAAQDTQEGPSEAVPGSGGPNVPGGALWAVPWPDGPVTLTEGSGTTHDLTVSNGQVQAPATLHPLLVSLGGVSTSDAGSPGDVEPKE